MKLNRRSLFAASAALMAASPAKAQASAPGVSRFIGLPPGSRNGAIFPLNGKLYAVLREGDEVYLTRAGKLFRRGDVLT